MIQRPISSAPSAAADPARRSDAPFYLFLAALLAGLYQLSFPFPFGNGFEMIAIARSLAHHQGFANPFASMVTGPTASNPPLYPLLLAALMKVTGPFTSRAAAALANLLNAFTAALLPAVSRRFYGTQRPGVIAAILWIASVHLRPAWDNGPTALGLVLLCLFCCSPRRAEDGPSRWLLAGVMAALLILLNPATILVTAPLLLFSIRSTRNPLQSSAILCFTVLLIVFPWMLRNRMQLGATVIRTNLGTALYVSNNDCAKPTLLQEENNGCFFAHHPNFNAAEAQIFHRFGEVRYDNLRKSQALLWIRSHPRRFAQLTLLRMRDFWLPPAEGDRFRAFAVWIGTLFSVPGLILMLRRRNAVSLFLLAALFLYPLMYYIVVSEVRYRYPILWLSFLPAGYCLHLLCRLLSSALRPASLRVPSRSPDIMTLPSTPNS